MARPNQYGFQPLSSEERSAQTQIGVGTALGAAGMGFPLLGALLTGVGVGQTGLKLAQGQELDAADYMNIGAPLGGAAVGQILKRALPALKALKRSNPQAAIKAEQEVAQELQAAIKASDDLDTVVGLKQFQQKRAPEVESAAPVAPRTPTSATQPGLELAPPPGRLPTGAGAQRAKDLPLDEQRTAPNLRLLDKPRPRFDTEEFFAELPTDSVYVGPMRNKSIADADVRNVEFFTDLRRAQRFPGGEIQTPIPRTGEPGKVLRFGTDVDLGRAGISDTSVNLGKAGIRDTGIAPARGYSKTTADPLDFPTNVQMRNVVGEQPEPTVAGKMLPGPGAFTSAYRRNTPAGNLLMPQVRGKEGLYQVPEYLRRAETPGTQMLDTKISGTKVSPSSFVSGRSAETTGPVGGARPVPKAPTKPADDTDLFGGRYGAVDDTAAYNEIPAGIPDTQVMTRAPGGMPRLQAMRNFYDEIPTGRKLAGIGAGLTGAAAGMSAGDDYGFSSASPMSVEPVKTPRKNDGYDAVPEQRKGPELKEGDYYTRDGDYRRTTGQYKLKSGDTVMDLIQTVTGNKKKQKELLSEIAFLNPGILTEKAFQVGSEGTNRLDSPDAIDPSKVKAGESLVLPPGVGDKLETGEKMLKARRAANMKKRADAKKKKQAAPAPKPPVEPPPSIDPVENMIMNGSVPIAPPATRRGVFSPDELLGQPNPFGPPLGMQHGGQVPTAVEQWKSMGGTGPVHMGKLVGRGPNAPARPQAPAPRPTPPAQYAPAPGYGKLSLDEIIRMGEADAAKGYVGLQQGGMVPKQPNYFWHLNSPSPVRGFQFGGSVGPTDTVPAMLTPGEHVIDRPNAEYVRQNPNDMSNLKRLANDIQNGVPSVPPGVQGYAEGGKVLSRIGVSGYNKPKRTPGHATKSHVVVAKSGDQVKTIRFGQQGVRGAGKNPSSAKDKARKKSYYARHNAQDSSPSKMSARYWSHKVKW